MNEIDQDEDIIAQIAADDILARELNAMEQEEIMPDIEVADVPLQRNVSVGRHEIRGARLVRYHADQAW